MECRLFFSSTVSDGDEAEKQSEEKEKEELSIQIM